MRVAVGSIIIILAYHETHDDELQSSPREDVTDLIVVDDEEAVSSHREDAKVEETIGRGEHPRNENGVVVHLRARRRAPDVYSNAYD